MDEQTTYHLSHLKVRPQTLPEVPAHAQRVLDVGCGAGQTMHHLRLRDGVRVYGVDVDPEALSLRPDTIRATRAAGESLPFAEATFDLVYAKLALPYMNIPLALMEWHRVLRPGGMLWVTIHPWRWAWRYFLTAVRQRAPTATLYRGYILINGLYFSLAGLVRPFPFTRRIESYQTEKTMALALARVGFRDITSTQAQQFIVTAKKPASPSGPPDLGIR
jgi:ubiquinone/menaquinone biosynthesis C-methylase UbiE